VEEQVRVTHNAIGSWMRLPGVEIMVFGTVASCEVISRGNYGIRCLEFPCVNEMYQIPQYDCIFAQAANLSIAENIM